MSRHARGPGVGAQGLVDVPTEALERMLARLHRGELETPITHPRLLIAGLPDLVDRVEALRALDARGAIAVIVAVIAERRAASERETKRLAAEARARALDDAER